MKRCLNCNKPVSLFVFNDLCNTCLVEELELTDTCTNCFRMKIKSRCPTCESFVYIRYGKSLENSVEFFMNKPVNLNELAEQIKEYKPVFIQVNTLKYWLHNYSETNIFYESINNTISNCG